MIRANVLRHRPIDLRDVVPEPLVQEGNDGLDGGQRAVRVLPDQLLRCLIELAMLSDVGFEGVGRIPLAPHELLFHLKVNEDVVGQIL